MLGVSPYFYQNNQKIINDLTKVFEGIFNL